MGPIKGWLKQLRALFRKEAVEREMAEEIAFHLRMETEENVRQGMSPDDARRAALVAFGGVERYKEQVRDTRWTRVWEDVRSDLGLVLRRLLRRPTFSATVILTLAVGLAAASTGYGIAYGVLLRPLPYPEGDELVKVWQSLPGWSRFPVSYPAFDRWRAESSAFAELAAYDDTELTLTGATEPQRMAAAPTTANLARTLGVRPARGRWFTEREEAAGASVVVISDAFWTTRLGGDPDVVGRVVRLDDEPYTVVGVMPEGVAFPSSRNQIWLPLGAEAREQGWNSQFLEVVGRLAPGVGVDAAARDVAAATARFVAEGLGPEVGSRVVALRDDVVGDVRATLLMALAAGVAVLMIAALNVASLFLARGSAARSQAAVRMALGAGRWRMSRELVLEGVVVAVVGAVVGLSLASVTSGVLGRALTGRVPRLDQVGVDAPVVLAVVAVAVATGVLLGLVASWATASGGSALSSLGSGSRGTPGRGARLFRSVMVAGQVAAVFVLISGAGLLLRSLDRLLTVDRGFDETGTLALVEPVPLESRYPDDEARVELFRRAVGRVAAVPGVSAAALVAPLPFSGSERSVTLTAPGGDGSLDVGLTEGSEEVFDVLGIPVLAGRAFQRGDDAVAVVGESLARRLSPDGEVVGTTMLLDGGATVAIVGVVGDIRNQGLADPPAPRVWVPFGQDPDDDISLVVRTATDPARLLPEVRAVLVEVEPTLASERLVAMSDLVRAAASFPRFRAMLVLILALAASVLAAVGIYGVTSHSVLEQRKELSIRSALGARGGRVVVDALGRELRVVIAGLVAGLPLALLTGRAVGGFLHGVTPGSPAVHALAAVGVLVVATLAVLVPALRAVRTNPVEALRIEEVG